MNKKQSLFHIAKRDTLPWYKAALIRGGAIVLALIVCAIVTTLLTGENPIKVYSTILYGAFGTSRKSWVTFHNLAILLGGKIPGPVLILLMIVAAIAAGALWGFLPAIFKAKWNTNETLFTLMMNYIATQLVAFYTIVWEVPKGSGKIGIINQNTNVGWLPQIFGSKYLLSIVVAVVITIFMYVYLDYSKQGYEISVVGESENTAKYVGIKVEKVIIRTMLLSGALCGLVGLLLVGGINHTVTTTIAGGQGFTAVLVSWMSKFNPLTMVFSSFLIIFMDRGASEISTNFGLNHSYSDILTGIILFFIIGCEFFITYRLQFRKKAEKEEQ